MAIYDEAACRRKADQHYEMAGLASQDGDKADAARHIELAKLWDQRAKDGGYQE
jgi:hypothetical protein